MKLDCTAACIAAFEGITDIKLIIEKDDVLSIPSMKIAVHCCCAVYYIFNLTSPTAMAPFLLFLEHAHGLQVSRKLPVSVSTLIDSLQKLP